MSNSNQRTIFVRSTGALRLDGNVITELASQGVRIEAHTMEIRGTSGPRRERLITLSARDAESVEAGTNRFRQTLPEGTRVSSARVVNDPQNS